MYSPTGGTLRILAQDAVLMGYQVPAGVSNYIEYIWRIWVGSMVNAVGCGLLMLKFASCPP